MAILKDKPKNYWIVRCLPEGRSIKCSHCGEVYKNPPVIFKNCPECGSYMGSWYKWGK